MNPLMTRASVTGTASAPAIAPADTGGCAPALHERQARESLPGGLWQPQAAGREPQLQAWIMDGLTLLGRQLQHELAVLLAARGGSSGLAAMLRCYTPASAEQRELLQAALRTPRRRTFKVLLSAGVSLKRASAQQWRDSVLLCLAEDRSKTLAWMLSRHVVPRLRLPFCMDHAAALGRPAALDCLLKHAEKHGIDLRRPAARALLVAVEAGQGASARCRGQAGASLDLAIEGGAPALLARLVRQGNAAGLAALVNAGLSAATDVFAQLTQNGSLVLIRALQHKLRLRFPDTAMQQLRRSGVGDPARMVSTLHKLMQGNGAAPGKAGTVTALLAVGVAPTLACALALSDLELRAAGRLMERQGRALSPLQAQMALAGALSSLQAQSDEGADVIDADGELLRQTGFVRQAGRDLLKEVLGRLPGSLSCHGLSALACECPGQAGRDDVYAMLQTLFGLPPPQARLLADAWARHAWSATQRESSANMAGEVREGLEQAGALQPGPGLAAHAPWYLAAGLALASACATVAADAAAARV